MRAYDVDGERYTSVPEHQVRFEHAKPIYEELPGWKCDITGCRSFDELPQEAQDYVAFIEDLAHTRVTFIGVGAGREQIINDSGSNRDHLVIAIYPLQPKWAAEGYICLQRARAERAIHP